MPDEHVCSDCGAKLSPDAQGGLCVRCLFNLGLNAEAGTETAIPVAPVTEKAGDRIGRYKLLQKIGEGGCGVVYMAEQEEPVRRRVALKVIKLGMDTREVIARFEAERQALAMMDHPNIAKIFDAGATDAPTREPDRDRSPVAAAPVAEGEPATTPVSVERAATGDRSRSVLSAGRPYFVMELVRGVRITEYCDQHNLPTRERLDLFIKVCQAIQHAHQKGIIHRDIKPSNILVTVNDGVPVPKVIDFGIAKATEGRLTDKTLFTAFQQFMGTPAYMSPEQAEMTSLDIDTRSDIYSLGVLLYELLTGKTPFDAKELLASGLDAMRRTIREQEPAKPSTRLSTMAGDDLTTVAKQRQAEPPKLVNLVRGDLDWIVMKCLEKDRTRRYETANGLAGDIGRYLVNEPVTAAAPSATYRFGKFARRNKAALGVAAVIAAILIAATTVSTWQAVRATRERDAKDKARQEAVGARRSAEEAKEEAESVSTFLTEVFQSPDPSRDGRTITVAETLDRAAGKLELELNDQPRRRARLQGTLGITYQALGLARESIPLKEKARDYYLAAFGLEHHDTLGAMRNLASSYHEAGRRDEALKMLEEVLMLSSKVLGPEHPDTLVAMGELAASYSAAGRRDEALRLSEKTLVLLRKVLGPEHRATLVAMGRLATSYYAVGRRDEGLKLREEVLKLRHKVLGPEHPDTLGAMAVLAISYSAAGRRDETINLSEEVLTLRRKVLGQEHPDTVRAMTDLATYYYAAGRRDEALNLREKNLTLFRKVLGPEHPDTLTAMRHLAASCSEAGRRNEALKLGEEVLMLCRKVLDPEHLDTLAAMDDLAASYSAAGRIGEALKLHEDVLMLRRKSLDPEHPDMLAAMNNLAASYYAAGRRDEALKLREEVLMLSRKVLGPEHPGTLTAMYGLAISYSDAGRRDEALKLREEVLMLRRKVLGTEHPDTLAAMCALAISYHETGRRNEALNLWEENLTLCRKLLGPEHPDTLMAMAGLASSFHETGRRDEALKLREEVLILSRKVLGPEHPDTLGAMNNLAHSHLDAGRRDEAVKLFEEVLTLRRKVHGPEHPETLRALSNLQVSYRAVGRRDEALKLQEEALAIQRKLLPTRLPRRAPDLNRNLIDLTAQYNASLTDAWHFGGGSRGSTLSALPTGKQTLAGVSFDVRGIVQLSGQRNTGSYPDRVVGIPIQQKLQTLHFLHATGWMTKDGTKIASLILHYTDGQTREVPIVYGEDLREWHGRSDKSQTITAGELAWSPPNDSQKRRLFKSSRPNPLPDLEVTSMDYVSAMTDCFPFLIAITAE